VRLEVEDTGPGIAKDELAKLFAPFVQSETGARAAEGTGLGLSISRALARQMGGDVTATSELGKGTTFVVELDLSAAPDAAPPSSVRSPTALAAECAPLRVLVADDTEENRRLLAKMLARFGGFEVREAARGDEALAIWEEAQPRCVFLDFRMEGLDGAALARAIREREKAPHRTALVALSASAFDDDRDALLAAGCDAFIGKPYGETAIVEALETHAGARFVYEESGGVADPSVLSRLPSLPAELRAPLVRAARAGDLRAARVAVAAVERVDADLGRALRQLVDAFRLEDIEAQAQVSGDGGRTGEQRA
jgi:CheY-like chemotaxis protein